MQAKHLLLAANAPIDGRSSWSRCCLIVDRQRHGVKQITQQNADHTAR
jgi:hypothetical protein